MMLFFIITAWAFLEALQDPPPSARLASPVILFSCFREMTEIFLLTVLGAGVLSAAEIRLPGTRDFLTAAGLMLFYFYGRVLHRRETFVWMAFACVIFFSTEKALPLIALRGAETAAGVTGIRMILRGIQKRQLFSPVPDWFSGLPAFFVTAALISLIGSALFVR